MSIKPKSSATWPVFNVIVMVASLLTMTGGYYLGYLIFGSPW